MAFFDLGDDELAYLQPGFDPASLKVAQLRNVLLTHGISYPSSAKKAELVEVFNTSLKPKAKKILSDHKKIKRSSTGIEDAASSIASTQEDDEPALTPAPSKRRRGRPKKNAPAVAEEDQDETIIAPPTTSRRRTPAPAPAPAPVKTPKAPATARSRSRTSRQTSITPAIKQENSIPDTWKVHGDGSPFSSDNPFQSGGSSPPTAPSTRRRKTEGNDEKEKRRKSVSRRRTDVPPTTAVTRKASVNVPLGGADDAFRDEEVEAGEEFVPEEQTALEIARREGRALVPVRRQTRRNGAPLGQFLVAFLLVSASSIAALWRQEKINVGYCGIGQPSAKVGGVEIPPWADTLRPQCEECPRHARCFSNLQTVCEDDFVLKHHPLSLNGLLPLPPTCEPDSEKEKRIKAVANSAVDHLRKATAKAECDGAETAEVSEEPLKLTVQSRVRKGVSSEEFDALWRSAIGDIVDRDEVVETIDEQPLGTTEPQANANFDPSPSQKSDSPAPSADTFEEQLNNILGKL